MLAILISTSSLAGGYLCTGFFISPDGYIGTAGHCAGNNMEAEVTQNGKTTRLPITIIAVDTKNDVMIGKVDTQGHSFFMLNLYSVANGDHVAYTGYPQPDLYGYYKHHYNGIVKGSDTQQKDLVDVDVWSRGGTSGSCVYDSNSVCVGVLTEGIYFADFFVYTGIRPVQLLINVAMKYLVPVVLTYSKGQDIDKATNDTLFNENKDKVVLITGETND